ncbi:MAG: carboxypeptidase regulatory-like domain-containing protein [Candidatus Solibacter sp.]
MGLRFDRTSRVASLAALALVFAAGLYAQGTTATISGTVTDSSGASIAGAKVTATNTGTNLGHSANTATDGSYQLLFLPVGNYKVEVNATGFKKFDQSGIILEVNRNARVDAVLQVGAMTESVEVKADAATVETSVPGLGQTTTNTEIDNLPLVNRDIYTLLNLTAGVDTTDQATDNFGAPMQVTIVNGSPNSGIGSVNYNLNGGSNINGLRNTGNSAPNPDAIQEFRVLTNSFPADEGRFGGATVTMISKSGTNRYSGTLFEFLRNDKLNANRWLPGASVLQKDPLHRNQFGGTVGGPIVKNRTFFFATYSGLRERTSLFANTATPLTAKERGGDLSATAGTAPLDPLTGVAFPGRIIPVNRIDPVAKKILDTYIPLPNLANGAFEAQLSHPKNTDEVLFKIDHNISQAHRLTGSFFYTTGSDDVGLIGNLPWVSRTFTWKQYNYNVSETWIVSPTMINQVTASFVRNFGGRTNYPAISLGDLGSLYRIQGAPSLPQIQVASRFNLNSAIPGPVAGSNQYQLRDVFSISTTRHSIRVGGEAVLEKMVHDTLLNNYGTFSFTTTNPRGSKNSTADFLLGLPATMNQDAPTTKINNDWYYSLYVQDDFRVTPRLTLNLGARWDIQTPITDPHNRFLTFVKGMQSKIVPTAPAGLLFPGDAGVARGIITTAYNHISPRIGFAWDPFGNRKTAIRGAAGIFYGSISGNEWNTSSDNQPFAIRQQFNDVYSLSDPYKLQPGGVGPFPYSYSPGAPRFVGPSAVVGISLDYKLPYTYQMNFAIQREITRTTSVTVAYVNNLTHRIPAIQDVNYPILTSTATTANVNARRPYLPGVLSSMGNINSILNSAYHGLQLKADRRFANHFTVRGFYTFGKGLDVVNTQASTLQQATDWNNVRLDRGRANNDRTHTASISGVWESNYFHHSPRIVRLIANGWSLAAIASMRSGTPLTVTNGTDVNFDGQNNDRTDLVGDPWLDPNRPRSAVVDQWFNIAAFNRATQAIHSFDGTAGRNIIDGPGLKNVDMTIARTFKLTERKSLQFRGEATNALNLVNLSNPGTSANTATTFGKITTARAMRQAQLGLKLVF